MKKLTNNAFINNTGHLDNEIDFAVSERLDGMKVATIDLASSEGFDDMKVDNQLRGLGRHESRHIKPQVDRFVFFPLVCLPLPEQSMNQGRNCTFDRSSIGTELTVFPLELTVRARVGESVAHKLMDARSSCRGVPG